MATKIRIGGRDFESRPLTLRQLQELLPVIEAMSGSLAEAANVDKMLLVIRTGLSPVETAAHPVVRVARRLFARGVSIEWLRDQLDVETTVSALDAILTASGLRAAKPGEAKSP